jgi:DNA-binding SARP family transcriptional activator/energy-coupling factor transporter ATP-binding protein EcfA2
VSVDLVSPQTVLSDAPAQPGLGIRLLGELLVLRAGCAVPLPASKRTRALLGYLVATGTAQLRQTLCDLLWDGPDDPRGALRWSLSKLRGVTDDDRRVRIDADRERVGFVADDVEIDVQLVQSLIGAGVAEASLDVLEQAADLLRGEFLDGLDLPACHRFHHWCMAERERHGAARRRVLTALTERLRDDPARALPHARALVTADPLSESAHATLILVLTKSGRQQDAEQHCERTAELLRREVGAQAAETLRAALREARRKRPTATPPPLAAAPPPAVDRSATLVGREAEWRRILEITGDLSGAQPMLLVLGEPGIGKSRLLEALAGAARERGARVAVARCFEAETAHPYGCLTDALRGLPEALVPQELRGGVAPDTSDLSRGTEADRRQLLARIAGLVQTLAAETPFVLILDDLQWVDEASTAVLHFLARSAIPGLLLAGAARRGELDDNPWVKRLLQSLAHDGLLERRALEALNCQEIAALTGLESTGEDAAATFRYSGGNPLLALELARARKGGADLRGQSLESLVADRVARLSEEERDALVWTAAFGRAIRPELLAACLGLGESLLMARVERLVRHGLLRPTADGQLDFVHDLVRQDVYRLQSQPHRRVLHRQIARVLSAVVEEAPELYGDLVHHAGLAEDHATAARACLAAAERCLRLFAGVQALEIADRGLAHLTHLPAGKDRVRQHIKLLELKAFASPSATVRDVSAVMWALERITDAAVLAGLYADAVTALHARSWISWHVNDDRADAERVSLRAEKLSRTADTATRCHQLANTGRCLLDVESSIPRALALLAEAEAMAEANNLQFVELELGGALAARWHGDLDTAATRVAQAVSFARLGEDHRREAECVVWQATIDLERGDLDGVSTVCAEAKQLLDQVDPSRLPTMSALQALAAIRGGDPQARAQVSSDVAALRALDDKWRLAYVSNCQAAHALEQGSDDLARAAASEALANARVMQRPTEIVVAAAILAQVAAASGDTPAVAAHLDEARALCAGPDVGARGRTLLRETETAIGARFPTLVHTMAG